MNYLPDPKIGDKFRWLHDGSICRITAVKDNDIQINFVYETGPKMGNFGYTLQPQAIEKLQDDTAAPQEGKDVSTHGHYDEFF